MGSEIGKKDTLLSNFFYFHLRGNVMENPMGSLPEEQEENVNSNPTVLSPPTSTTPPIEFEDDVTILSFIYVLTRSMYFAVPFVSVASMLSAYQGFIHLSILADIPPLIFNLYMTQIFFLIVSVPMSVFCVSLFDRRQFLTPAYTAMLMGTILVGLNSLGIGFLLILAGVFTYSLNSNIKRVKLDKTEKMGLKRL